MKKIYSFFFLLFIFINSQAQTIPNFWSCNRNFLDTIPGVAVKVIYNEYYGKGTSGSAIPGFKDVRYTEDQGFTDGADRFVCGGSYACKNNDADGADTAKHYQGTLKYDVYYPSNT